MARYDSTSMATGFVLYTLAFFTATAGIGYLAGIPMILIAGIAGALITLLALLTHTHFFVDGIILCYFITSVVYAITGRVPHSAVSFTGILLYYVAKKTVEAEEFWRAY